MNFPHSTNKDVCQTDQDVLEVPQRGRVPRQHTLRQGGSHTSGDPRARRHHPGVQESEPEISRLVSI